MDNNKDILTIAEMTALHFKDHGEESIESIQEYLETALIQSDRELLEEKFKDESYYKQFRTAILQTSFMITLMVKKATEPLLDINFDKFNREFFAYAQKDDKDIYEMRMYYFNNLNAEAIGIGYVSSEDLNESEDPMERDLILQASSNQQKEYNNQLQLIKNQYLKSKIHLK